MQWLARSGPVASHRGEKRQALVGDCQNPYQEFWIPGDESEQSLASRRVILCRELCRLQLQHMVLVVSPIRSHAWRSTRGLLPTTWWQRRQACETGTDLSTRRTPLVSKDRQRYFHGLALFVRSSQKLHTHPQVVSIDSPVRHRTDSGARAQKQSRGFGLGRCFPVCLQAFANFYHRQAIFDPSVP